MLLDIKGVCRAHSEKLDMLSELIWPEAMNGLTDKTQIKPDSIPLSCFNK